MLNVERFKREGLTKLKANIDYIPISVQMNPELFVPIELRSDHKSINCTSECNDTGKDCQKKFAILVCKQDERNYQALEKKHKQNMLKVILKILSAMAKHFKIKLGKQESTANKDVITKAALLIFFQSQL